MDMEIDYFVVVSDRFTNYHGLEHCIAYSSVIEIIENEDKQNTGFLIIGQGISDEQVAFLNAKIKEKNSTFIISDSSIAKGGTANKKETHKHYKENVLITSPKGRDGHFTMNLLVNERGELLQDHFTGYHLQGMLLIEAARQAFLAVTEKFYYHDELPSSHYFVINSINTTYTAFVFALETTIEYAVLEHLDTKGRQRFRTQIDFKQNDVTCTSIEADFTVFDAKKINQKEYELVNQAINTVRESLIAGSQHIKAG